MRSDTHTPMEDMEVFKRFVAVGDWVWNTVSRWRPFEKDTIGKQLVRAADSVGANLVEGDGRHGQADALHFFVVARASARETRYWLQRAQERGLVPASDCDANIRTLESATQLLNRLISYRRSLKSPRPEHLTAEAQV